MHICTPLRDYSMELLPFIELFRTSLGGAVFGHKPGWEGTIGRGRSLQMDR